MKVSYIGPDEGRAIGATGDYVKKGESVEVDYELGQSLCDQADQWHSDEHVMPVDDPPADDATEEES